MGYPGIDTERPEPDLRPTEVNFVLLGRTGAGKSASGNTILGKKVFESKFGAKSKTNECREATALVSGRRLTVLDTPGLYDTRHGMEKFESEMPKVKEFSRKGQCILLLVIELGRFTEEEENSIRDILKSFPREPLSKFMILFTNGDRLEGQPIEEFLEDADDNLQRVLDRFGNRYHVFNNKSDPDDGQVLQLLEKADDMLMEDQQSKEFPIPNLDVIIEDFIRFQCK
ncbi:GTPase IMAP family member 9-like [Conger conger]|uniref:GTPase IMAP family member 9-like n=1 Tax=Conger conger TaxID=82655 RepID=UPI002A5A2C01|nr:GTPase IMAP family member 9-like [Conger conger]